MPHITVDGTQIAVDTYPGETVLAALRRTGNALRSGCRRGGCGICKVEVLEGTFDYNAAISEKVLSDDEKARGVCLTCRAVPSSDVVVSLKGHHERVASLMTFFSRAIPAQSTGLAPGSPGTTAPATASPEPVAPSAT